MADYMPLVGVILPTSEEQHDHIVRELAKICSEYGQMKVVQAWESEDFYPFYVNAGTEMPEEGVAPVIFYLVARYGSNEGLDKLLGNLPREVEYAVGADNVNYDGKMVVYGSVKGQKVEGAFDMEGINLNVMYPVFSGEQGAEFDVAFCLTESVGCIYEVLKEYGEG